MGVVSGVFWKLARTWHEPGREVAFLNNLRAFWIVLEAILGVLEASGGLLGGLGPRKVANMAPTWLPKQSPKREKNDAKIDQNFDASWGRFLERFWWILGGKMEPSWHQKRTKNRSQLRKAHFTKNTIKQMEF